MKLILHKATTSILNNSISYSLETNSNDTLCLNDCLHKPINITFLNQIICCSCGAITKKSFMNGYCFRCFQTAPETAPCILHPEKCRAHENEGRDIDWEIKHHLKPHHVYIAYTGNIKVGVTRDTQIPTRWIDQGATQAAIIATTPNRYLAGCIEVALKQHLKDKTAWQTMLKNGNAITEDFQAITLNAQTLIPQDYTTYVEPNITPMQLHYPLSQTLTKVVSNNLDKTQTITGTLAGIKGQYLLFDNQTVFNLRRHTGYVVELVIG